MSRLSCNLRTLCLLSLTAAFVVLVCGCTPLHSRRMMGELQEENRDQAGRVYRDRERLRIMYNEILALHQKIDLLQRQVDQREQIPNRVRQFSVSPGQDNAVRGQSSPRNTGGGVGTSAPILPPQSTETPADPTALPEIEKGPPSTDIPHDLFLESLPDAGQELPTGLHTGSEVKLPTAPAKKTLVVRKTDSSSVHEVRLMKDHIRPLDYDGLHVEFQMRDAGGNVVLAAAPVRIMVTDPSRPRQDALIGEWKYSAEEIAEPINVNEAKISIPLDMAWRKGCPRNLKLQVHLLYVTSDRRYLTHNVQVDLESLAFADTPRLTLADMAPTAEPAVTAGHIGSDAGDVFSSETPTSCTRTSPEIHRAQNAASVQRPVWGPDAE